MRSVLSKLALVIVVVGGPPLAGRSSAQYWGDQPNLSYPRSFGNGPSIRRQAYLEEAADETIPPGSIAGTINGGMPPEADEGYALDESGEFPVGGPSQFPYSADALDEGGEALIPDGYWNNRGPLWYGGVAATLIQRSAPGHQATGLQVSNAREIFLVGSNQVLVVPQIMTTAGLDFHFTPGMRLTVGRNLYEDILRRQHSIEFSYLGLNSWETGGIATAPSLVNLPTVFRFPFLFSLFPLDHNGFNLAQVHRMSNSSSFNNFEMNYRISCLPRADRMAQQPDGHWMQVGTPGLVWSFLSGVRVFTFDDHFQWLSNGTIPATGQATSGMYNVKATNALIGAQFGGDVFMNFNTWSLGTRAKAGIYGNNARQSSEVQIIDPVNGNQSGVNSGWARTSAFIGDFGMVGSARLTERVYFRTSYDFMWIGGLALAPSQLQYTTNLAPTVRKNGSVLLQGVSLGFDFCW